MSGTISFPPRPNDGDLYASSGRVYEFLNKTWNDVTSLYAANYIRRTEPPQDGQLYMRTRGPSTLGGAWKQPPPVDLSPYFRRDGSQPMTGPLLLADGQPAVSAAELQREVARLRALVIELRDYVGARERPDDPRGKARGRTYR